MAVRMENATRRGKTRSTRLSHAMLRTPFNNFKMSNDVEMKNQEQSDDWVKIVSQDGFAFVVKRDVARQSGTLKSMISDDDGGGFAEAMSGVCNIHDYRGAVVEKVVEYMIYKKMYGHASPPEVVPDFQERIYPEIALELLTAADYLEL